MKEEERKVVKLLREGDELIGVRIKCEFDVVWTIGDFDTSEEVSEFVNDPEKVIEAGRFEFNDSRTKSLDILSEEILEFVDVKINVCHKCGLARQVIPKGIVDWPQCSCIGQTWFSYETQKRTMEEAKEILEKRYEEYLVLYRNQSREIVEFQALNEEYCIGEDGKLDMTKVRRE